MKQKIAYIKIRISDHSFREISKRMHFDIPDCKHCSINNTEVHVSRENKSIDKAGKLQKRGVISWSRGSIQCSVDAFIADVVILVR